MPSQASSRHKLIVCTVQDRGGECGTQTSARLSWLEYVDTRSLVPTSAPHSALLLLSKVNHFGTDSVLQPVGPGMMLDATDRNKRSALTNGKMSVRALQIRRAVPAALRSTSTSARWTSITFSTDCVEASTAASTGVATTGIKTDTLVLSWLCPG